MKFTFDFFIVVVLNLVIRNDQHRKARQHKHVPNSIMFDTAYHQVIVFNRTCTVT